jgi:hypothetical protein
VLNPGGVWASPGYFPPENVHLGRVVLPVSHQKFHYTHGFWDFHIPKPKILKITEAAGTLRIEGNYFTDVDPSATIHTDVAFDGTVGGSWVFFRDSSGVETAAPGVAFEVGLAGGPGLRSVLGIDGQTQTSTGHVLTATIPAGLANGFYDIIVRQYRKYGSPATNLHIDEDVAVGGWVLGVPPLPDNADGWGSGGYGEGSFGD